MASKTDGLRVIRKFGTVELQERPVFDGNRIGYECRKVTRDRNGVITDTGPWNAPLCWVVSPEPEPVQRPWWVPHLQRGRARLNPTGPNGEAVATGADC